MQFIEFIDEDDPTEAEGFLFDRQGEEVSSLVLFSRNLEELQKLG